MYVLSAALSEKHRIAKDEEFQGLAALVSGLERIASGGLQSSAQDALEPVPLQEILDNLRIVIEPDWREIDGTVLWQLPPELPIVLAERHGLLQAFLNVANNSHRAAQ